MLPKLKKKVLKMVLSKNELQEEIINSKIEKMIQNKHLYFQNEFFLEVFSFIKHLI